MTLNKKVILTVLIFVTIIGAAFYLFTQVPIFADSLSGQGNTTSRDTFYLKLIGNRFKTRFVLTQKPKNAKEELFELKRYSLLGGSQKIELQGFEKSAAFEDSFSDGSNDYLFFTGDVGAHSRNLFALKITQDTMLPLLFKIKEVTDQSISSDLPKIEFKKSENSLDILVYNRDYDQDPLKNYFIDKYQFQGDMLVFVNRTATVATEDNQPESHLGGIK